MMKKQNKNKALVFGLLTLFTMTLVAAIGYYAFFSTSFNVESAIVTSGNTTQDLGSVYSGGLVEGELITVTNNAPSERTISFSDETNCLIETSYTTTVDMNMKIPSGNWDIIDGTTILLSYTTVGDNFYYKVNTSLTDYVVVYYPDLDGNPGSWNIVNAELVGDAKTNWTLSDIGYLPNGDDWNDAAKLWVIPSEDWGNKSWNPSAWYFENNLVTYGDDVTIPTGSSIGIIPLYDIAVGESGDCTVTTEII